MGRLIIVSNRLPMSLDVSDDGSYSLRQNVGGLATAIGPYHKTHKDSVWVGWSGVDPGQYSDEEIDLIREQYESRRCVPIFLSKEEVDGYYAGFSNDTMWPLLHDFAHEANFDPETWRVYQEVNEHFLETLVPLLRKGDKVWIQDYHLMLLPQMLRERFPEASIGWFLHVPFPSPEIFRSLPWSREILEGILGADLVGFHTVDYAKNFEGSVELLLDKHSDDEGRFTMPDGHEAAIDAFPIGIDYNLYRRTSRSNLARMMRRGIEEAAGKRPHSRYLSSLTAESNAAAEASAKEGNWWSHYAHEELPELHLAKSAAEGSPKPNKVIVSVDRLDYTKGIPERLRAYQRMLEKYPEWAGHVTYYLLATPSRENVDTYKRLKEQVDQLVGQINGKYSLLAWSPIHYITRSLPIKPVCGIYAAGDVALVTPLRDGMNLVAKEYLACHDGRDGSLVLSDMCGAAAELSEAFIVNPYDTEAVCEALHDALETSSEESAKRNIAMQARLKSRTAATWCAGFVSALEQVADVSSSDKRLRMEQRNELMEQWGKAGRRLVLCDYDGTLTPLARTPEHAKPTRALKEMLRNIASHPGVDLVIVSGRSHETMNDWFSDLPVGLIAEHGVWFYRYPQVGASPEGVDAAATWEHGWQRASNLPDATAWKQVIQPILEKAVAQVPKSFIEHKDDAIAWHYRLSDQHAAAEEKSALLEELRMVTGKLGLMVMENAKVVEICPVSTSKGQAVRPLVTSDAYDFMLAVGDDTTDETMFAVMPEDSWTIKIGPGLTKAHTRLQNPAALHRLLAYLDAESEVSDLDRSK
ncbi:trehalose-phosphatase [Bifidobacterium psychraerophilum]|uniref:trehalose-phosphatase n=1 Tax=Bifidobacterium psychraerophilum TaxID=218140 RepID=UPI0039E99A53